MKKEFRTVVICALVALMILGSVAMAEEIDLAGMSYDDLVELKDRINKAMWECEEWQEVTVPQGLWLVGEDIPAGHWTIEAYPDSVTSITIGDQIKDNGQEVELRGTYYFDTLVSPLYWNYKEGKSRASFDYELRNGEYVEISNGYAVFKPYTGKPSLGFK